MDSKAVLVGFLLYFVTNFLVATFLTGIASMIGGFFGALGTIAVVLGSSIVSFPALILVFYLANRAGIEGDIPEVSYALVFIPFNYLMVVPALLAGAAYLYLLRKQKLRAYIHTG